MKIGKNGLPLFYYINVIQIQLLGYFECPLRDAFDMFYSFTRTQIKDKTL